MNTSTPTTKDILAAAKAAGLQVTRAGTLNGVPAYRLEDAQKHGMACDPFGRSAALLTAQDIARRLGWAV